MPGRSDSVAVVLLAALSGLLFASQACLAQGGIAVGQTRPFVIATIPVVGNGVVGGVAVDGQGIVSRAKVDKQLQLARLQVDKINRGSIESASKLRKVSLRGLQRLLQEHIRAGKPLPVEAELLAGLQRVEYVFLVPERNDIVLAGPAEPWQWDDRGHIVGRESRRPVLRLDDLLVALRGADDALETAIYCSIEPTKEGIERLRRLTRRRGLAMNARTIKAMEAALGPQRVRLAGIPAESRFARILLAADFMMKRLAMHLEASPVKELSSYMQRVQESKQRPSRNMMPRWWLEPAYEPITHSPAGLVWRLPPVQVKALTEENFLDTQQGITAAAGEKNPLAESWAADFTRHYGSLSRELPVFAELENCMDLAVVAALVAQYRLLERSDCELKLLLGKERLQPASFEAPQTIASEASFVRRHNQWVISLSGGVQINSWAIAARTQPDAALTPSRRSAVPAAKHWWWD